MDEILSAIDKFEQATITAWVSDTEDSFNDRDRKSTKEAHAKVQQHKAELIQLIQEALAL